ncbi:MAG: ribulose-phosphate 3-epimerase [Candidatus Omnitrophota bacterium]
MAKNPLFKTLKESTPTISVGILTADLMALGSQVRLLEQTKVRMFHFDVMDGVFCPMMTFGPPLIKAVKTPLFKDVHLMITEPLEKVKDYVAAGADIISVHAESSIHIHRVLQALGKMSNQNDPERGLIRGVALNPGTPVEVLEPLLNEVDVVTLLAINPGWSGQQFIPSTRQRVQRIKRLISESGREILICVDGGITRENIAEISKMGADIVVTGSAVFDGKTTVENAAFMIGALHGK